MIATFSKREPDPIPHRRGLYVELSGGTHFLVEEARKRIPPCYSVTILTPCCWGGVTEDHQDNLVCARCHRVFVASDVFDSSENISLSECYHYSLGEMLRQRYGVLQGERLIQSLALVTQAYISRAFSQVTVTL